MLKPIKERPSYSVDGAGRVFRLVAKAFIPNPEKKACVCYKDNNPLNNRVENLCWGSHKENIQQARREGRMLQALKKGKIRSRLSVSEVLYVRSVFKKIKPLLLAQELGVSLGTIKNVIAQRCYREQIYQI